MKTRAQTASAGAQTLLRLEVEEREISQRRAGLHRQIDSVYLQAPLGAASASVLDRLEELERRISDERRILHARIDEVRAQIGRPPSDARTAV